MAKPNNQSAEAAKKVAEEAAAAEATKKAAKEAAAAEKSGKKVPALRVTAKRDGFRRGGRAWSKDATTVKLSDLNDEQIEQIKGEAMLEVEEVEIDE